MKRVATLLLASIILSACGRGNLTLTPTTISTIPPTITPLATITPTTTPTLPPTLTPTRRLTFTPTPSPTPIPFAWKRLTVADFMPREPVTAIAIDPMDPNVLYAGTESAGLYKSVDGGVSWFIIQGEIDIGQVDSIVIDPQDSQIVYVGTSQFGVYKTQDGGRHWRRMTTGIRHEGDSESGHVIMDSSNSQHLFYMTGNLIHESNDGAQSWRLIKPLSTCPHQLFTPYSLSIDPTNRNLMYASHWDVPHCETGVYRSSDGGRTWALTNLRRAGIDGVFIERVSAEQYYVYAHVGWGIEPSTWGDEFYVSSDEGESWRPLSYSCSLLVPHPEGGMLAYCGGAVRHVSRGGATWRYLGQSPIDDVRAVAISSANPEMIVFVGESVYISFDGGRTWRERNHGLPAHRFEVRAHPADPATLLAYTWTRDNFGHNRLFVSKDRGYTWTFLTEQGNGLQFDADHSTLYRYGQVLYRSVNGGSSWQTLSLPGGTTWQAPFSRVFAHPSQPHTLYFVACNTRNPIQRIYISRNRGESWNVLTEMHGNIGSAGLFFAGEGLLYLVPFHRAYRSADGGVTWKELDRTIAWSSPTDYRMVVDPRDPLHILVASMANGVLGSSNGGDTWTRRNRGLETPSISALILDPQDSDIVYAATDNGAYVSFDFGIQWHGINAGLLGNKVVYSITADKDGNVYAAAPSGIYVLRK